MLVAHFVNRYLNNYNYVGTKVICMMEQNYTNKPNILFK